MKDWFHWLEAQFRIEVLQQAHGGTSLFSAYHNTKVGRYPQTGALFYATPKNASSSVHLLLLYAEGLVSRKELQDPDFTVYDCLKALGSAHWTMRPLISLRDKKNLVRFSFVRNPWSRLLSFYTDKIARPDNEFLSSWLKLCYPDINFQMDFPDFVRFVHQLPEQKMEPHFLPQHYFFRPQKMDFVGRCENFSRDIERLISLLKPAARRKIAAVEPPRLKSSRHDHYTEYYNEETRRLVQEKYAHDIELFGYRFGD